MEDQSQKQLFNIIENFVCKDMYKPSRLFSVDFPLINKQQYDQRVKIAARTIQIVSQSLEKEDRKCLRKLTRAKEEGRKFKEVQNGLKDYNKLQIHVGSLALNLISRPKSPMNLAVLEKSKPKSKSAYLTTYESFNRKLQICRRSSSQQRKENTQNLRKKTTVHRIIAPTLTNPNKQRLKIQNSRH